MPTYKRFEELPAWQMAADLAAEVFTWSRKSIFRGLCDLSNQIQRATLSISNNIAEGFERGTTAELIQYLYIARGSAGEVRSMLCVLERMSEFQDQKSEIVDLKTRVESISRQIRAWADSLQNSQIKGQKHLNDVTKAQYERKRGQSEFMARMDQFRIEQEERLNREVEERNRRKSEEL